MHLLWQKRYFRQSTKMKISDFTKEFYEERSLVIALNYLYLKLRILLSDTFTKDRSFSKIVI